LASWRSSFFQNLNERQVAKLAKRMPPRKPFRHSVIRHLDIDSSFGFRHSSFKPHCP
jgi:hypothetical protein